MGEDPPLLLGPCPRMQLRQILLDLLSRVEGFHTRTPSWMPRKWEPCPVDQLSVLPNPQPDAVPSS